MSQNILAVGSVSPRHGRRENVDASGRSTMSASKTREKPSTADPSKPMPSAKAPSSSAGTIATDLSRPWTSGNHSRMKRTSLSCTAVRTRFCCLVSEAIGSALPPVRVVAVPLGGAGGGGVERCPGLGLGRVGAHPVLPAALPALLHLPGLRVVPVLLRLRGVGHGCLLVAVVPPAYRRDQHRQGSRRTGLVSARPPVYARSGPRGRGPRHIPAPHTIHNRGRASMRIGVPTEIKPAERRVAITPAGVSDLTGRGHEVVIQQGAGLGSHITDDDYTAAGA